MGDYLAKLTEKQKRFSDEFLIDLNATQAASWAHIPTSFLFVAEIAKLCPLPLSALEVGDVLGAIIKG